jgi:DNA-binding PadR family transcriptional regulator
MARPLGLTSLTILAALEHRRCYGLDLVDRTGLLEGTVYTTLRRMEKKGLVEGSWEDPEIAEQERRPRRRYYTLRPEGARELELGRARVQWITAGAGDRAARGEQSG